MSQQGGPEGSLCPLHLTLRTSPPFVPSLPFLPTGGASRGETKGSGARLPGFKSWLYHSLAVRLGKLLHHSAQFLHLYSRNNNGVCLSIQIHCPCSSKQFTDLLELNQWLLCHRLGPDQWGVPAARHPGKGREKRQVCLGLAVPLDH
jgi:hypothetical protein